MLPEILSYLSSRPMLCLSHAFTNGYMNNVINEGKTIIARMLETEAPINAMPEVPTVLYTTFWRPNKASQMNDIDYMWRPTMLGVVPWYFFAAMCECNDQQRGALPWHSFQNSDGAWKHHPFICWVKSQLFPYTVLLLEQGLSFLTSKGTGNQMCYLCIITRQAWMEPSILAEFPKTSHCYKLQFCPGLPCLIHAASFPSLATPANRLFRTCFCKCVTSI